MEAESVVEKTQESNPVEEKLNQEETDQKKEGREYFKSKYAILFGYSGKGYCGLQFQKNEDVKTIERDLEDALVQAKLIHPLNQGNPFKTGWARASRTDKGVHAVLNGINAKLDIRDEFLRDTITEEARLQGRSFLKFQVDRKKFTSVVNGFLPDEIRVFDLKVVPNNFDIQEKVFMRRYEYIVPFKVFYPYKDEETVKSLKGDDPEKNAAILGKLKEIMKLYVGTKNYHNYTPKGNPNAKTNTRYIPVIECESFDTSIYYTSEEKPDPNIPLLKITLVGQSFIYNQIRKMVGMMINVISEGLDEFYIQNSFCKNKMNIWLAPGEGLLLDRLKFDAFNQSKDAMEKIEYDAETEAEIEEFKRSIVYREVVRVCHETSVFDDFIIRQYSFNPYT